MSLRFFNSFSDVDCVSFVLEQVNMDGCRGMKADKTELSLSSKLHHPLTPILPYSLGKRVVFILLCTFLYNKLIY